MFAFLARSFYLSLALLTIAFLFNARDNRRRYIFDETSIGITRRSLKRSLTRYVLLQMEEILFYTIFSFGRNRRIEEKNLNPREKINLLRNEIFQFSCCYSSVHECEFVVSNSPSVAERESSVRTTSHVSRQHVYIIYQFIYFILYINPQILPISNNCSIFQNLSIQSLILLERFLIKVLKILKHSILITLRPEPSIVLEAQLFQLINQIRQNTIVSGVYRLPSSSQVTSRLIRCTCRSRFSNKAYSRASGSAKSSEGVARR